MAVTANQVIKRQDGRKQSYPVEESTVIYQGTMVFVNAAGYAVGDDSGGTQKFVGIAINEANNGSGGDGDIEVEVWETGDFALPGTGFTQADVGSKAYATDNFTVTTTANLASLVGDIVRFVSSTEVVVRINAGHHAKTAAYTITNHTVDRAMDADTAAAAEIADVLGTVISDLIAAGVLNGTVAA